MKEYVLFIDYLGKAVIHDIFNSAEAAWEYVENLKAGMIELGDNLEGFSFQVVETARTPFVASVI